MPHIRQAKFLSVNIVLLFIVVGNFIPSDPPGGKVLTVEELLSSVPQDGVKRNCRGLIENLQLFGVKEDAIIRLVSYCDYGVIGHPVWQAVADIRNAGGKIQQPVRFIWSRLRKGG